MSIEEENFFVQKKIKAKFFSNKNILLLCFDFCDAEDILNISFVCKEFKKLTEEYMDYKFVYSIEKNYFSNYANYE